MPKRADVTPEGPLEKDSPLESIDKGLRALLRLGETGPEGLSLTKLAADLGLNKGSLHRTLSALRHRTFVAQDSKGNYRLGTAILALADSYLRDESLRRIFHDGLSELCARINETCHLGVLMGDQIVYIDKVEPQRALRIWSEIGWRNPALCTALGRAILSQSYVDYESFAARFPGPIAKRTTHTRTALRSVWQELVDARKRGFAMEERENELGVTCMAVALMRGADVIAAVSVTTPSDRMDVKRGQVVARTLRECLTPYLPPGLSLQNPIHGMPRRGGSKAGRAR